MAQASESAAADGRSRSIRIPRRFNGPPDSANGGYSAGAIAAAIPGPAEVTLRRPPPLDRDLALTELEDGSVVAHDGDLLVAEARPSEVDLGPPGRVTVERARRAAAAGFERWSSDHPFPSCVVCGPDRDPGDGLRIFPGQVDDDGNFAADWTPSPLDAVGGMVRPEIVWASLDCPTSAPVANYGETGPPIVLARLAVDISGPVRAGEPHAVVSWPLGREGRKRHAGAALFDAEGRLLGRARALWIELRPDG